VRFAWKALLVVAILAQGAQSLVAQEVESKLSFIYSTKRFGGGDLCSRPLLSGSITRLTLPDMYCVEPAVSPDGQRIAYTSYRGGTAQIFVSKIDLTEERPLSNGAQFARTPAWSPDGASLVYATFNNDNYDLFITSADGQQTRALTTDAAFDSDPAWSPDGDLIAFTSNRTGAFRLYTMKPDGAELRDLLGIDLVACVYPAFSPDGETIAFGGRGSNGTVQLCTVDKNGNGLTQITPDSRIACSYPAWSPDGRYISYVRFERWPNAQQPNRDPADDNLAGDLMLYDTQTKKHTQLTSAEGPIWGPRASWLPLPKDDATP
jgi:Tol biopolymer transport system component